MTQRNRLFCRFAPKPLMHLACGGSCQPLRSRARRASRPCPGSSVVSRNPCRRKDVRIGNAGSRATQSRQSRQVRKEATVTG